MGLLDRIWLLVTWVVAVAIYLLVVSGTMNPIHGFILETPAVHNGPFWGVYQNILWAGTLGVPAILIGSPVAYWLLANVRREKNEYVAPRP